MSFEAAFRADVPTTTVHYRQGWAQEWTEIPHFYVNSLGYSVGGGFGRASLLWKYGRIMQPGTTEYAVVAKLNIDRYYIRITYTPPGGSEQKWYGVIISAHDNPLGNDAGDQSFTAVTMDWLLTQKQVASAFVKDGQSYKEIQRPVSFNIGPGAPASSAAITVANKQDIGHFDADLGERFPLFAENLDSFYAEEWSGYDIIRYLLYWHPPSGTDGPAWSINETAFSYLDWFHPVMTTEGRTLHDIINATVDQRRGLAWYLDVTETGCEFNATTYSPVAIELSESTTIPANTPADLELDDQLQVGRISHISDSQQKYSQVRVTGARRGACFTVGPQDDTLEPDWTDANVTAYLAGDTTVSNDNLSDVRAKHDAVRNSDALSHVFTRFRIPEAWVGWAGDGATAAASYVCPIVDPFTGEAFSGSGDDFWRTALRFRTRLPLLQYHDYRENPENPDRAEIPDGLQPDYLSSFAVAEIGDQFVRCDIMSSLWEDETSAFKGTACSCRVVVVPNAPALHVQPTSAPHAAAIADYPTFGTDHGSEIDPCYDWHKLRVTVFVDWDAMAEATWPETPEPDINDQAAVLTIRAGDRYRMDWLNANTVLGVENGQLVRAANGGFVRNDHRLLSHIAQTAWQWYSVPRRAIRMDINHVSDELAIGDLIGEVDGTSVNSLVTSKTHDFLNGTTHYETQFANLDARLMI